MNIPKTTFALFFGNRGFFPASLIAEAREEMPRVLKALGHDTISLDAAATRHGAVETPAEGRKYAAFLREHRGEFDGVILCLPNFGDETGAVAALEDAGVPILVQAYPDELDKMAPELRRDAFCGKFSVMDVFCQYGIPFTALKPHTVAPPARRRSPSNIDHFDRVCRVVNGMKRHDGRRHRRAHHGVQDRAHRRAGPAAPRHHHGDLRPVRRLRAHGDAVDASDDAYKAKADALQGYTDWNGVPDGAFDKLVRAGRGAGRDRRRVRAGRPGPALLDRDADSSSASPRACCSAR